MPLAGTGAIRVVATALAAAALSAAMWLVLGRGWMALVATAVAGAGNADVRGDSDAAVRRRCSSLSAGARGQLCPRGVEASQEAQRRGLQGQVLAREAELRSLRAQIDPHFLFNSLHSISALTTADPPSARRMCLLLGDFLRQTLALGGADRITLSGRWP